MKFAIPEISWHNRDPILSVDFQPKCDDNGPLRLATGGTDSHIVIWYITTADAGSVNIEVAADLTRHQKAVNVVRWSPNGQLLASGDDESIILLWQQKTEKEAAPVLEQGEEQYKESWVIYKTLRGHMEDVLDLCWSPDSLHIASGSVDNKLMVWDISRGRYSSIITDHKGFVQGVAWDPQKRFIATASSDRVFRVFDISSKKAVSRSSKATLPFLPEHPLHNVKVRLYHDDTLQTYYRRLHFSPDGLLIAVPAGRIEPEQGKMEMKPINAVYIYTRYSFKMPACVLPCGEAALVARWSPVVYRARGAAGAAGGAPRGVFAGSSRLVLAVATKRSVLIYDTHQKTPLTVISNIHYTRLTDLTWSSDGRQLVASSTDGYCSVISFGENELGEPLPKEEIELHKQPVPTEVEETEPQSREPTKEKAPEETKPDSNQQKIDSFIELKTPSQRSPKKQKGQQVQQKTPVKMDVLEEVAVASWLDHSNNDIVVPKQTDSMDKQSDKPSEVVGIADSEDIKLVYDDTESTSISPLKDNKISPERIKELFTHQPITPKSSITVHDNGNFLKQAKVIDIKEAAPVKAASSPKAPRRVSFVTLSSPTNAKKKKP